MIKNMFRAALILALVLTGTVQAADWKDLIDGKDLSGWEQVNGTARYQLEGDTIVGYTVMDSPNSFLSTKKQY